MNKLRFLSLLLAGMMLCGCAAQPVNQPEASVSTVATAFTEPETSSAAASTGSYDHDLEIFNRWKSNNPSSRSMSFGFADSIETHDNNLNHYDYTGGELHVQITAHASNIPVVGALLFLDGRPQPYRTADSAEYKYMYCFTPGEESTIYDLWFIPITGKSGDKLELTTLGLANPDYQITDGPEYGNHTAGCTGMSTYVNFQTDSTPSAVVAGVDCILESSVSAKDLTDSEFRKDFGGVKLSFPYRMSINYVDGFIGKSNGGDKYYNTDLSSPVQVDVEAWGDDDGKYGLVLYLNNEPINPEEPFYFQTEPGKKTIFHFTLDLSEAGEYPVIYGVIAARNYWENGLGTGADDFSHEIAPAYLTEAADLWDLLGIQEITQN